MKKLKLIIQPIEMRMKNNEKIDINNEKDEIGLNISQNKNFKINKNKSLGKNKTIDINNNKIIDDFLSDKNITNKNDEFLFDTNNNHNNKNLGMKRIKTTYDN